MRRIDYNRQSLSELRRANAMQANLICRLILAVLLLLPVTGCASDQPSPKLFDLADRVALKVYKSPTCGCCGKWIEHAASYGFDSEIFHPRDLNAVKAGYSIPPRFRSCHTAVSPEGYVFEGHIPAKVVRAFLDEPPVDAIGLAVPAMPVGSPGMEVDDKFMPYQVLLLKKDGAIDVFAEITAAADQY